MALYEFVCGDCGAFEVRRPPAVSDDPACPDCGRQARRVFGSPLLRSLAAPLRAAREREARSAHQPEVVRRPAAR